MTKRPTKSKPSTKRARPETGGGTAPGGDEPPIGPIAVDVVQDEGDWSAFGDAEALVLKAAAAVGGHHELAVPLCEVAIALADDAEVAALNGAFRNKQSPTNVLSFPAPLIPGGHRGADARRPLGDIILARETIVREAADLGIAAEHHLQHLVVHGLLHLLGYDHTASAQAQKMEALEVAILAGLGIADPYAGTVPLNDDGGAG